MMTNFKTMRTRIDRLAQLKKMQEDGTFDMLPKKEVMKLMGEMAKLEKYLGGVKEMKKLPGALFVIDSRKEHNAIAEARKLHIPIVAIVDTNCDPDEVDYVIPADKAHQRHHGQRRAGRPSGRRQRRRRGRQGRGERRGRRVIGRSGTLDITPFFKFYGRMIIHGIHSS